MERKAYLQLLQWKQNPERKPLILNGARQVGKTWLLQNFGSKEYQNTVYLNCDGSSQLSEIFNDDFNTDRIIRNISAVAGQNIEPQKTLIIIDEIQQIPRALPSLKYFCENAREYHIAAAGSLLGLSLHQNTSFPVGKVDMINLYPLSFSEFVKAAGGGELYNILSAGSFEELAVLHPSFKELLRQYYFTGGMPECVSSFINGKTIEDIRRIQQTILYAYEKDISKHAPSQEAVKIHQVWQSIPQQLAKENKKFIYGALKQGARAKSFENAVQWLIDAGIVYKINRVRKAGIPLKFYEDFDAFKLYIIDCGLFGALAEAPADQILIGNSIFEEYKGAFTEQFVLQQIKTLRDVPTYYFSAENSKQELDFILQNGSKVIPVEVKAEENLRAKSLSQFVMDNPETRGVRLSMSPFRQQEWMTNIPLYAAERILNTE